MSIILSASLVRRLALTLDMSDTLRDSEFPFRESADDKRTFDHKLALLGRAQFSNSQRFSETFNGIKDNHGVKDITEDGIFVRYVDSALALIEKRKLEGKRKHAARVERQRELEAERAEVALLLAA